MTKQKSKPKSKGNSDGKQTKNWGWTYSKAGRERKRRTETNWDRGRKTESALLEKKGLFFTGTLPQSRTRETHHCQAKGKRKGLQIV